MLPNSNLRVTTCPSYVSWQNFIWEWHFPAFQLTELSVFSTTALIANGKHASLQPYKNYKVEQILFVHDNFHFARYSLLNG